MRVGAPSGAPTRIQTLKKIGIFWVPRLQLPNKRVNFGAPSYVGREYIWILPPTTPPPSNQTKILWTSWRALGGDVCAFQKQGYSIQNWICTLSVCHVTAWQGVRRSCRTAAKPLVAVWQPWQGSSSGESSAAVGQLRRGELGGSPAAQLREYNPFFIHVAGQYGLQSQGQSSFPPILRNHGWDNPHYESFCCCCGSTRDVRRSLYDSLYHPRQT